MIQPRTLDDLRRMPPGEARALAIAEYIEQGEGKLRDARKLRDEDLRTLASAYSKPEAARRAKVSLSTVKNAVGRP